MYLADQWTVYYSKAKGCEVWGMDGKHYYDTSLISGGANVLGYAFDYVDEAARKAIDVGGMCILNAPEEVELAELLILNGKHFFHKVGRHFFQRVGRDFFPEVGKKVLAI